MNRVGTGSLLLGLIFTTGTLAIVPLQVFAESNRCESIFSKVSIEDQIAAATIPFHQIVSNPIKTGSIRGLDQPGLIYRGMILTPDDLRAIISGGLGPTEKSDFDVLYFSTNFFDAKVYATQSVLRFSLKHKFRYTQSVLMVIVVIDPRQMDLSNWDLPDYPNSYYRLKRSIPTSQIHQIYLIVPQNNEVRLEGLVQR